MIFVILSFLSKKRSSLLKSKLVYLFLILAAMLISSSASPQVSADFTTTSVNTGCGSLVVEFQDLSTGSPDTWLWDFGNGNSSSIENPTVIYANPGVYDVTLVASNSISNDTKTLNSLIKVYDTPISQISNSTPLVGCMPLSIGFTDLSFSNNGITNWQWDFGDGGSSTLQNPMYEYSATGMFSVSLLITDVNGCQSLSTELNFVQVDEVPNPSFIADIPFSCNVAELVSFTNNTVAGTIYTWDFGDGNTSALTNPTHNYSSGIYTVSLSAKVGNCIDTLVMTNFIEIGASLTTDFTSNINSGCEGLEVEFSDLTLNSPDDWEWDFGDGNTSAVQNPVHIYLNSGVYDVTLKTSKLGQCNNMLTLNNEIEVFANPVIQIIADTTYACTVPFNVEFSDATINAVSWNWDFGNGTSSVLETPSSIYINYGIYNVDLTVVNTKGCTSVRNYSNFIEAEKIDVNISSVAMSGCLPFDVDFLDSTSSARTLVDWNWSFGDGNFSSIQNPSHQFTAAGLFDISLSVKNDYGCIASANFPSYIKVNEAPQVEFEAAPIISCAGQNIDFFDNSISSSAITSWFWDFGDGSTSNLQNPIYQYQLTGNYDVTLITGVNNCTDTFIISDYIKIIEPTAIFIEEYDCDNPLTIAFDNLSIGADNVFWDFGDGTTSALLNPVHTYSVKGVYNVSLAVTNNITGCTHEFVKPIKLTIPIANFDYLVNATNSIEDSLGCVPHDIYLNNLAEDWSYYKVLWSDGYIGYGRIDHVFTDTGRFDVTMIVTDLHGCKDTMERKNMYKINDVVADFGIVNVLGCDSMLVEFEDLSSPSSSVVWEFGDGGGAMVNNPQHIYYNEGFYDITLYAKSLDGCKDTLSRLEYIHFQYPTADFSTNMQGICPGDMVQFSNLSGGIAINSDWDFGDGTQGTQIDPVHSFIANGQYDISLLVTDSFGCTNSMVLPQHIEVLKPTADFITAGISSNCPPLISNFSDFSTADVTNWEWIFSDGGNASTPNPSHLFTFSGNFDVSLIVTNHYGCKDTLVKNNLIDIVGPIGSFSLSDTLICRDDTVQFIPIVSNTSSYLWDLGNGILSTDSFPNQVFTSDGIFLPSLIIENASGCQFTINNSDTITVRSVNVDAGIDVEICEGEQVQLNAVGNTSQFAWNPTFALTNPNLSNPVANPVSDVMYFIHHFDGLCSATDSVFVKVYNDIPSPSFTTINHCDEDIIQFNANSGLITNNIAWIWSFGASIQNPTQQLVLGTNSVQLIVVNLDNTCSDTLIQQVEIYPLPIADFSANEVCLGEQVLFIDNSSINTVNWDYNFADGIGVSTNQNPTYIYASSGLFQVSLNVVSDKGCEANSIFSVLVNELPITDFSIENNCEGVGNTFTDLSAVNNNDIASVLYDFNNGITSSDSISSHVFVGYGLFNVKLTSISNKGCESSVIKSTEVFANPLVDFTATGFCEGSPSFFNDFSFVANSSIDKWNWTFENVNSSSSKDVTYVFANNGLHNVSLAVTSIMGCTSELSKKIQINELPSPNFRIPADICFGDEVKIIDLSEENASAIVNWNYNFGDGNTSNEQNPTHTYNFKSQFDVSLTITSAQGCVNDTTMPAITQVHALPIADFHASTFITSELESEISFYNQSSGATTYVWSFGNGNFSSEENPIYYFNNAQDYEIILTAINEFSCTSEMIKSVYIHPEYTFFIPDAFTPNGDGNNDIFTAQGNGVTSFEMQVYDRWGGIVFESSDMEYGWDGLDASANKVGVGTYLYHVAVYDYNEKLIIYNGEINLMR
jgi:gliding motility-associated-like protein